MQIQGAVIYGQPYNPYDPNNKTLRDSVQNGLPVMAVAPHQPVLDVPSIEMRILNDAYIL